LPLGQAESEADMKKPIDYNNMNDSEVAEEFEDLLGSVSAFAHGDFQIRDPEKYGNVQLSVQASAAHHCSPCVTGLPLTDYRTVEIALFNADGVFCMPSAIGIKGFDDLFDKNTGLTMVARDVPQTEVEKLREALRLRAKGG